MGLAQIRERMEREFAAVRADLKRMEGLLAALQRDAETSRDVRQRVNRAGALARELEWKGATRSHAESCPVCHGVRPAHEEDCGLAAVIKALGS